MHIQAPSAINFKLCARSARSMQRLPRTVCQPPCRIKKKLARPYCVRDPQVASELAPTIASEILALLQGAAPFIHNQQAWVSICSLLKIIQYDAPSYPVVLDTLTW